MFECLNNSYCSTEDNIPESTNVNRKKKKKKKNIIFNLCLKFVNNVSLLLILNMFLLKISLISMKLLY